jgi:hypothetical protein
VEAEYWIPNSHSAAGRFSITNTGEAALNLLFNIFGQLVPIDGQSLAPQTMQSVNVLAGRTTNLFPVIFITGGPHFGQGPFPSLCLDFSLPPGEKRVFTWVQAALEKPQDSFDMARHIATRSWESELAKIEMVNSSETVEITTGDPDWDAAFAFSQKAAFHLCLSPTTHLPQPSFVLARQPDHGFSQRADGRDYNRLWNGQPVLESLYLAGVLPGAPELAAGFVRNFLVTRSDDGRVDWKPGLAGQRGRWMAAPLLATLAWNAFQKTKDHDFLKEIQGGLAAFIKCWFDENHDGDQDGFPEWENVLQSGFEDHPVFSVWHDHGQGIDIAAVENPALAAMLCREMRVLAQMAEALDQPETAKKFLQKSGEIGLLVEECWNAEASLYHNRDRDTHASPAGREIGTFSGSGVFSLRQSFRQPTRVLVQITLKEAITRRVDIQLRGQSEGRSITERLERMSFQWGQGVAVATTLQVFNRLEEIQADGLQDMDSVIVKTLDLSGEDISQFLPLWAETPHSRRAQNITDCALFDNERFWRPFGIPICPGVKGKSPPEKIPPGMSDPAYHEVHLPWNGLVGEAIIDYGFRVQAAELVSHLMSAIISNLKLNHAFSGCYHSESGAGIGERNALQGLAPISLFLKTLGVEIESNKRVVLNGMNPFPWPVTVQYKGLTVTRDSKHTFITFPTGQHVTCDDPTNANVSIE